MPTYCYKCPGCGEKCEKRFDSYKDERIPFCEACGALTVRDFGSEQVTNTYHPTVDLYANSLKQRAQTRRRHEAE